MNDNMLVGQVNPTMMSRMIDSIELLSARVNHLRQHSAFLAEQAMQQGLLIEYMYLELDRILETTGSDQRIDHAGFQAFAEKRHKELEEIAKEDLKNQQKGE